MHDKTVNDTI